MADGADQNIEAFIARWSASGGAERANYQLFLSQLAQLIGAPEVDATVASEESNTYVFEKAVRFKHADGSETTGWIDLYKKGCFVCEAKQSVKEGKRKADEAQAALFGEEDAGRSKTGTARVGTIGWDLAMERARRQAEGYAKALPKEHGWPPFLVIVDVGHCIELFADFSGQGKNYAQFPDRRSFRIMLDDLNREDIRARLKLVWTDPHALDPAKRSAEVTRDIAERLAFVAKDLEKSHDPQQVALFLMRCLFTMFAEDVELLPKQSFYGLLEQYKGRAHLLQHALTDLWKQMDAGGFHSGIADKVRKFNGGLFRDAAALPTTEAMLGELLVAARRDWRDVEPAIFGTLLERALKPEERAQLGAHYTPRAYVERLVVPTIMEPLQEDWAAARVEAQQALETGDRDEARKVVRRFHGELCKTRVLDPACGTGNFLYVAMEMMKRLEGEVLEFAATLGDTGLLELDRVTVDPHNFLGIELNPRAKEIAELVIWIGFIKWQIRTGGQDVIRDPVLRDFKTIECRDAILAWDRKELRRGEDGTIETVWDGTTHTINPATDEEIRDESARVEIYNYITPRPANWPVAEFVIGNPPFISSRDTPRRLGDGYVEALKRAYPKVKRNTDFVLCFWAHALSMRQNYRAVGLVSTSRIRLQQNSEALRKSLGERWAIKFAIPDHDWPDERGTAKVRISMIVAAPAGFDRARLVFAPDHDLVHGRTPRDSYEERWVESIKPDLQEGVSAYELSDLGANAVLCHAGVKPYSRSLHIDASQRKALFPSIDDATKYAPKIANGRDIGQGDRGLYVIDVNDFDEFELRAALPATYEYLLNYAKPERATEKNEKLVREWWKFEANRDDLRAGLAGLSRYIVTLENSPQRYFEFLPPSVLPDQKLRVVACEESKILAVLSSRFHEVFSRRFGGRAGKANTPVYNSACFQKFPFPVLSDQQSAKLSALGEELYLHRKQRQAEHPTLTLTDMYNVLEKLRAGAELSEADRRIHEQGLVSTLKRIHDEIDAEVAAAYGWRADLSDVEILDNLVALNKARAEEEKRGLVRWLRPEFQNPSGKTAAIAGAEDQTELDVAEAEQKPAFPDQIGERARAVRQALIALGKPATPKEVWQSFRDGGNYSKSVRELLETMTALGQAVEHDGRYFAS